MYGRAIIFKKNSNNERSFKTASLQNTPLMRIYLGGVDFLEPLLHPGAEQAPG